MRFLTNNHFRAARWTYPFFSAVFFYVIANEISAHFFKAHVIYWQIPSRIIDFGLFVFLSYVLFSLSRRLVLFLFLDFFVIELVFISNAVKLSLLGGPITPSDMYSVKEFLLILPKVYFISLIAFFAVLCLVFFFNISYRKIFSSLLIAFLAIFFLIIKIFPAPITDFLDSAIGNVLWNQRANYQSQGPMAYIVHEYARFISAQANVPSREEVLSILRKQSLSAKKDDPTAQETSDRGKPNIYFIILESFWDPSVLVNARFSKDPLSDEYRSLWKSAGYSRIMSPTLGGMTANAEFESLCGLPVFTHNEDVVFNYRIQNEIPCLPQLLAKEGYQTLAFHPNVPDFWNRKNVYKKIGFSRYYSLKDFKRDDMDGIFLSDESLFRQVEGKVKSSEMNGYPKFVYILSIGSHVPYKLNTKNRPLAIESLSKVKEVKAYANSVFYASKAIAEFIAKIQSKDPNAIIITFGDHAPILGYNLAGYRESEIVKGDFFTFSGEMLKSISSTPLIVMNGMKSYQAGELSMFELPELVLQIADIEPPPWMGISFEFQMPHIRPLGKATLILESEKEAEACFSAEDSALCAQAVEWRRNVEFITNDILAGRQYSLEFIK